MKTHLDEILYIANRTCAEGVALAGRDHSPDEYKSLLTRLGSAVEVFLKDHAYVGAHDRWNFEQLINGLEPMGVTAQARDFLHDLRKTYNKAKHDPTYDAPIQPVITILTNSNGALEEISKLGIGNSNQPSNKVMRRLLWFAAWDHFIGGDTEIAIFLPCSLDIDIPPSIETIYLKMEDWDVVKRELAQAGNLCLGRGCLPVKFFDFWSSESDFLDAGSFEGDLRDMIAVFSRHERVEDILPWLKRENEPYSMLAAALFAATDLGRLGQLSDDCAVLTNSIITTAGDHYAAPCTSALLREYAAVIGNLIGKCDQKVRAQLSGPFWVGAVRFAELQSERLFQIEKPPLMVLQDGSLVALV